MDKIQLVDSNGSFSKDNASKFSTTNNLPKQGLNFLVIAIMGPQSSGKSTLLNNMFGTNFQVMDVTSMISQTTKGIWLSRSNKDTKELVLVLDLEGSDSLERGEDDTSFEKRSALFALSFGDIVLINMGFKEVGRLQQQLFLRTILQANVKLQNHKLSTYNSSSSIRKPVLLFSVRDVDPGVNLQLINSKLNEDLNRIWKSIKKPANIEEYDIQEFFKVQVCPFAHYNYHKDIFIKQVQGLREDLRDLSQNYVKTQPFRVPGSDLINVAESDWELIQRDRDLDLPAQRKLQAEHKCRTIMEQCLNDLEQDPTWVSLSTQAQTEIVPKFREQALKVIQVQNSSFQDQSQYYDDEIAKISFMKLQDKIKDVVSPLINKQMTFIVDKQLVMLKENVESLAQQQPKQFSVGAQDMMQKSQKVLTQEAYDLSFNEQDEEYIQRQHLLQYDEKAKSIIEEVKQHYIFLSQKDICNESKKHLQRQISRIQAQMPSNFWDRINVLYSKDLKNQLNELFERVEGFSLTEAELGQCAENMEKDLAFIIDNSFKQLSMITEQKARERFTNTFNVTNGLRRDWGPKDNVEAIAKQAMKEAIQVVAVFAASQLRRYQNGSQITKEEQPIYENLGLVQDQVTKQGTKTFGIMFGNQQPQNQKTYIGAISHAVNQTQATTNDAAHQLQHSPRSKNQNQEKNGLVDGDDQLEDELFGLDSWENFDQDRVYLQPSDVRNIFQKLQDQYNWDIKEAKQKQDLRKSAKMPVWGWAMMAVLGYQEALYLVKSPLILAGILFVLYFLYSLYQRIEVDKQIERGLPGLINIGQTILPASQEVLANLARQLVESIKQLASNPPTTTYIADPNSRQEVEMASRTGSTQNSYTNSQEISNKQNNQNQDHSEFISPPRKSYDYKTQS